MIGFVDKNDIRRQRLPLLVVGPTQRQDDDAVAGLEMTRGRPIKTNHSRAGLSRHRVGMPHDAIGYIGDLHHFERTNVDCVHQFPINGDAPHVGKIGLCNPSAMYFSLANPSQHYLSLASACGVASVLSGAAGFHSMLELHSSDVSRLLAKHSSTTALSPQVPHSIFERSGVQRQLIKLHSPERGCFRIVVTPGRACGKPSKMSQMPFITRFVAYFPDPGDRGREELVRLASRVGSVNCRLLRQAPYLLAVSASASTAPADPADTLLDVFPGTAASARLATTNFHDAYSIEELHTKAEASAQCYNLLQSTQNAFLLQSDVLGLKPVYTAPTPGGNVLASRTADIVHLFPSLAGSVDTVALYEMLGFWAPLAGRTLHRRIRRTLPGGCYQWTPSAGFSDGHGRELRPVAIEPQWFMDGAIEAIHDAVGQSLREKTANVPRPVLLAFSGGFDSRFIAALCRDQQIPVRAVTYGRRHHSETHCSRGIARALGIDLQILPQLIDGTLRYMPQYLDVAEGMVDPAGASIMNLCRVDSERGSALLHGFGGDVQEGARLSDFSAADYASRESLVAAIMRHAYPASRPDLTGLFGRTIDLEEIRADILAGLRQDCPPYQAYLLWFLENRHRRFVAAGCAALGQHFDMVMPLHDRRLYDLWHSIPPLGLADRTVFKHLLARCYPALARIPHPEEAAPVTPNLRWQLARFHHRLPAQLLAACVGQQRADELRLRLHRHHNFRTLSKLEAPQQRAHMLSELARLQPALGQCMGIELSPGYENILARDSQALRTMFGVARYAARRRASARTGEGVETVVPDALTLDTAEP
ncbi:MAG TPA: asparagine synthase-related protein [Oleiagrimonas sp.]|nr:asparagine synthase-related protein [Oleiagrimonas sp.]